MSRTAPDLSASLVAEYLIRSAARMGRSRDYFQILRDLGAYRADAWQNQIYELLASQILPSIADSCRKRGLPLLSCLAVSFVTRKPEDWFRIFCVQHDLLPKDCNEQTWSRFVSMSQVEACEYWGKVPSWPDDQETCSPSRQPTNDH
jgi:hypothetical protein